MNWILKLLGKKEKVYKAELPPPKKKEPFFKAVISFEFLENDKLQDLSKGIEEKPDHEPNI